MDQAGKLVETQLCGVRICCAADKRSEKRMALRRAAGKKRRVPHRATNAKSGTTRYEKAKSGERMPHLLLCIAKRNDSDRCVLNGRQKRFERRVEPSKQLPGCVGRGCKNHVLCRHG